MNYFIYPNSMSLRQAKARATPHMTNDNVVFVPSGTSTVLFCRSRFPLRRPRSWLRGTVLARVDREGNVEIIHRQPA